MEFLLNYGQIGLVVFLLGIAMVWMFNRVSKIEEKFDKKIETQDKQIAKVESDLRVNDTRDQQTVASVAEIIKLFEDFKTSINGRLDHMSASIDKLTTEFAYEKGRNQKR